MPANANVGSTASIKPGYKLTNVWSNTSLVGQNALSYRSGVGANDKFFVVEHAARTVHIYDSKTQVGTIAITDIKTMWPTATADKAGNIIVRLDKVKEFPYTTNGDPGFMVIDSKTNAIENPFIPMTQSFGYRADALGHIDGNILTGEDVHAYIVAASNGGHKSIDGFCYSEGEFVKELEFPIYFSPEFPTGAQAVSTTGVAQGYDNNAHVAALPNNTSNITASSKGYGNCILRYDWDGTNYVSSNQYFITPQHASMGGFLVFDIQGNKYIIYPAGQSGDLIAGDAIAISEVAFTDSPVSHDSDTDVLLARAYAATNSSGGIMYYGNVSTVAGYNVEYIPEEPNSVYLYSYAAGTPMNKWKFTVPDNGVPTGVESLEVDADAPVEYYNLQGVRVANPDKGIYIKRQGAKATKVVF